MVTKPKLDPGPVLDLAPTVDALTDYDRLHLITYIRLLDCVADGVEPEEIMREVLQLDPRRDPERARRAYESHVERARWMTKQGVAHVAVDKQLDQTD